MIFLTRMNDRIYSYQHFDRNEYLNKYLDQKYLNIQIYSSHSDLVAQVREMEDKLTTVKTRKQQELIEIGTDNISV